MSDIATVTVLGAGTMGHGIAHVAAAAGYTVRLRDIEQGFVDAGIAAITKNLAKGVERGKVTEAERDAALGRITGVVDLAAAADGADLVIEAIPEKMELKIETFQKLDEFAPKHAVLASNTSSLPVTEIAGAVGDPGRVIGMHFFNPPHLMKLVELVIPEGTHDATIATAEAFCTAGGKTSIRVKDSPGFASSRLGLVLGLEAMRMVEQGVASAEDIDTAMTLGYRHPMGPLALTDLVGLDVRLSIAEHLHRTLAHEGFRPPAILKQKVAEGKLGKKSGEGFYKYD
ncbi:MAG: 3-hydroxyacyl-CoA dehydrogenase family protein [Planctomycetota bacterium]